MLLKDVPAAMRSAKSMVAGSGDPSCAHTSSEENPAYKPDWGRPATTWLIVSGRPPLMLMEAMMGLFTGMLEALTRMSAMFSATEPWAEKATETPPNDKVFGVSSRGCDSTACGPVPLSTVKTMPVSVLPDEIRLVMLAFIETVKFAMSVALGWPVQTMPMSPIRSARPSTRTMGGTALVVQITDWADRIAAGSENNKMVRTAR